MVDRISGATNWEEYYEAYRAIYRSLFEQRWALGRATFAEHLHHTAIPDAFGSLVGPITWAAYSQASLDTLLAFLAVFAKEAARDLGRARSNRLLFLVPSGERPAYSSVMAAVGDVGAYLDFWSDSFEAALNVPQEYAVLDSLNSLLAGATPLIERGHLRTVAGRGADGLRLLKARAFEVASGSASIFPRILREGFIGSAFILTCSQAGLSMELAAELAGQEVGVAAFLAVDRAQNSGWSEATIGYCNVMLQQHPPASTTYIVRPGDTLSAITRAQYGVTFQAIWPLIHLLNPKLNDPNRLLAGQCLILPALGGRKG